MAQRHLSSHRAERALRDSRKLSMSSTDGSYQVRVLAASGRRSYWLDIYLNYPESSARLERTSRAPLLPTTPQGLLSVGRPRAMGVEVASSTRTASALIRQRLQVRLYRHTGLHRDSGRRDRGQSLLASGQNHSRSLTIATSTRGPIDMAGSPPNGAEALTVCGIMPRRRAAHWERLPA